MKHTLGDYLTKLAEGKLSNLALSSSGEGLIKDDKLQSVITAMNIALDTLYTQFTIKQAMVIVEPAEGKNSYELTSDHSWLEAPKDIDPIDKAWNYYLVDDRDNRFKDDILQVLQVYADDRELPLNDPCSRDSVATPSFNIIQINNPDRYKRLFITYRAKHTYLTAEDLDTYIDVPDVLQGPLYAYVAYQVYSGIGTEQAMATAAQHYQNYTLMIQDIHNSGVFNPDIMNSTNKFYTRGWV